MTGEQAVGPETRDPRAIPSNVRIGPESVLAGSYLPGDGPFRRFRSRRDPAIVVGRGCTLDGVYFNLGEQARLEIGDYSFLQDAYLIGELEIRIGRYVCIGWHATIVDADFHPLAPAERLADAVACSPLGGGRPRRAFGQAPVILEDDVWIGPNAMVLKGVRIGRGAWVEPGAVVVHDVAPGLRVSGNPARPVSGG